MTQTQTMKAFAITEYKPYGELDHLKEVEVPMPAAPTGHDILVRIKAVATNPIDYKALANLGNHETAYEKESPYIVGWDASGIVESVGEDVTFFKVSDEVMFAGDFTRPGAFAEYTLVDERIVAKKPSNASWGDAASLPLTWLTAFEGLVDRFHIPVEKNQNANKSILITAGAGGVGSAAIAIAKKLLGLTVIATASRPETEAFVKERGADYVISHREAYAPQLAKLGFDGVNYIFHCSDLTPDLFVEFTEIVKPFGDILSLWPACSVDLMKLFWKSINFSAELMFTRSKSGYTIERQHEILSEATKFVEEGLIVPSKTQEFELTAENLRKALEIQASGKAIGKMALTKSQ